MQQHKVLVVEDDATAREQLVKVIQKEGFEVVMAKNGRVGLEMFDKEQPDIVITDLKMPEIDGMEVMRRVKKASSNVQVLLVTAFGETDIAISALREGALDYLKKPLDLDLLTVALGRAKEKVLEYRQATPFPSVLLADDEDGIRRRLAMELEKEGWKVFQAGNGEEAVKVFQETKIDIVLLDIKMPKKDGLQTLHEMRQSNDDFEAIILTGYGDESSATQAMRDGAINFLKKPIDLDQMILAVEKALEKMTTDRSLKYRTRELELAQEIIAKITDEKEIIIDVRDRISKPTKELARKLLDTIPAGLVAFNRALNIRYINRYLASRVETKPKTIDEKFVEALGEVGIHELSFESLKSTVDALFDSPIGTLKRVQAGKYASVSFIKITILDDNKREDAILMVTRGERP